MKSLPEPSLFTAKCLEEDMVKAKAFYRDANATEVAVGNRLISVERRDIEGRQELCPWELLAASIASCITLTLAAVAAHKGIEVGGMETEVEVEPGEEGGRVSVVLRLKEGLTKREEKILLNSARYCEIGKFLERPVSLEIILGPPLP
jgi:uncharacterized OsmC-like protein